MQSKRAIIVHGWDGYPSEGWFPWLKRKLEEHHFAIDVPQMPQPEAPKIESWVAKLAETVGQPTDQTSLIGHSIGCQTILRYLATLPPKAKVGPVVLVAPFLELLTLGDDSLNPADEEAIAEPWLTSPIDYDAVGKRAAKIVAIFSDDDPFVPLANVELFEQRLGAETIVLPRMGHFSGSSGTVDLPIVLEKILNP